LLQNTDYCPFYYLSGLNVVVLTQHISTYPGLCLVLKNVTWEQFYNFTSNLSGIFDGDVSPRYVFGQICLTRFNLYATLLLHQINHDFKESNRNTANILHVLRTNSVRNWSHVSVLEWLAGRGVA
jgi:hypothetical protein